MYTTTANAVSDFNLLRAQLEVALDDPQIQTEAHYLLWEVCQACGDLAAALAHLDIAIHTQPLRSRSIPGAVPSRSVLAIAVPGDLQANLPVGMLLNESTQLHVLWLAHPEAVLADPLSILPLNMPKVDCIFIAIAEDSRHKAALHAADVLAEALRRPIINCGNVISQLSRDGAASLLADTPGAVVPSHCLKDAAELLLEPPMMPFIIRPRTSHAGHKLDRVECKDDLDAYLRSAKLEDLFFVAPFVDYSSSDGLFRKYRIVFVDGVPYPVHLAIHDNWKVWYYNAGMDRQHWKRAEEEQFMSNMSAALGDVAMEALREIGRRLRLDYVGLDCAVLMSGHLLIFEIETGMIVHDCDPAHLFPYKHLYIPRIFSAIETMIDERVASWTNSASECR